MTLWKAVVAALSFFIFLFQAAETLPQPSVIRERHVIHAPIKFKVIHHYKIKKVPIVIKKHLHYHKQHVDKVKPILEDVDSSNAHHLDFHQHDDSKFLHQNDYHHPKFNLHQQDDSNEFLSHLNFHQPDFSKHHFHQQDDSKEFLSHLDFHQPDYSKHHFHQQDDSKLHFHQQDDSNEPPSSFEKYQDEEYPPLHQGNNPKYKAPAVAPQHTTHNDSDDDEDYDDNHQSEEDYDDYEYQ